MLRSTLDDILRSSLFLRVAHTQSPQNNLNMWVRNWIVQGGTLDRGLEREVGGWLAGWLAGRLADWVAGWPSGLAGRLASWLAVWQAGWLADKLDRKCGSTKWIENLDLNK